VGFSSLRQALGCKIPLQGVHTNLSNLSAPPPPKKAGYIFPNLPLYIVRGNSRHVLAAGRCQPNFIAFRLRNEQKRSTYPVNDCQTIAEFRATFASLASDGPTRRLERRHFLAEVPAPAESRATEYWACAHENGLTLGLSETEQGVGPISVSPCGQDAPTVECGEQGRPGRRWRNRQTQSRGPGSLRD